MGGSYVGNAGVFLIKTIFGLYILIILLRLLLQTVRADFYNPLSQFIVKVTNPPLVPLRRIIPGIRGVDMAAVVLLFGLQFFELSLVSLVLGNSLNLFGLFVLSVAELLSLTVNVFFFTILIQVILSWVSPGGYNPAVSILYSLNEPLLRPARKFIPPIGGLDLSPIVVMILLQLLILLLVAPIMDLGAKLLIG